MNFNDVSKARSWALDAHIPVGATMLHNHRGYDCVEFCVFGDSVRSLYDWRPMDDHGGSNEISVSSHQLMDGSPSHIPAVLHRGDPFWQILLTAIGSKS